MVDTPRSGQECAGVTTIVAITEALVGAGVAATCVMYLRRHRAD